MGALSQSCELSRCVSPDWGSHTAPSESSQLRGSSASQAAVSKLWNGLEPGPIMQGPVEWPPPLLHRLSKDDTRRTHSAGTSRRPTELEVNETHEQQRAGHGMHGAAQKWTGEEPPSPTLARSRSEAKLHLSTTERRTIACAEDARTDESAGQPQDERFRQLFASERWGHGGRAGTIDGLPDAVTRVEVDEERGVREGAPVQRVYHRLYTHAQHREVQQKKREELKARQEMQSVTGRPAICPLSKSMLRQARSFEERLSAYQARAQLRAQALKAEVEAQRAAEEAQHAQPPNITKLSRRLFRGVTHLSEWEKMRLARLAAAMEEKRRKEDAELTFSPTIGRRSRKLAGRTFRTPRMRMLQLAKPKPLSPPPPLPSFHPTISPLSAQLCRPGSVTVRLHYESHARYRMKNFGPKGESREDRPSFAYPDVVWLPDGFETWDEIRPACGADAAAARDWSEATAYGSHYVDQSPASTRFQVDSWAEDAAFQRPSRPERPWAMFDRDKQGARHDKGTGNVQRQIPKTVFQESNPAELPECLSSGLGEPREARNGEDPGRPRPVSDPCHLSNGGPSEEDRGFRNPSGGGASTQEEVLTGGPGRGPGLKRSQSFRENPKEEEKWVTIRERILSGPKHWHELHAPGTDPPDGTSHHAAVLARTVTFPADLLRTSFDDAESGPQKATDGMLGPRAPAMKRVSLKLVIAPEERTAGDVLEGAAQSRAEAAVTKVPYNAKYRSLFV